MVSGLSLGLEVYSKVESRVSSVLVGIGTGKKEGQINENYSSCSSRQKLR
ncbi:hypothetical protein TorRG33x02_091220 [Trema orientale]|uniref:Uncharacterized protein n=1 Tax=Trema orientale TaxID=63057 RepID=A0A2P5FAV9_TREOI|nr:hypothetical protein TorRG33x02_091220 [Trema orientale]